LPGRSLLPSLRTGDAVPERASYAWLDRLHYAYESVELGARKLIRANRPERWGGWPAVELYDLGADRAEHRNLALERDVFRRYLEGQLRWTNHLFRPRAAAAEAEPDPELERSLRALGYLN
jgi:hypothetical protein